MQVSQEPNISRTVLVLDDCVELLELSKHFLEKLCACATVTCKNLDDLRSTASAVLNCDLAILDINLGPNEPTGVDAYRWLRGNGFDAPIYFLTGHARSNPLVLEAEKLGDTKVLSKPLSPYQLAALVGATC